MAQAESSASQLQAARTARDRAVQEQQAAVQRSRSDAGAVQRSLDEAQAALTDAHATHRASLAAANAGRKDLQVWLVMQQPRQ